MSRPFKWILAFLGIFLSAFSLYTIYMSGKPVFDSYNILGWVGFGTGFFILMLLVYYLNVKVGIAYTILLLLLLLAIILWDKSKNSNSDVEAPKETSIAVEQQINENGDIVITHPYDDLISLQWGTSNNVDMDLMLFEPNSNIFINFNKKQHIVDENNSIWLDYDYQSQNSVARKEVITILGMKDKTFSVMVLNYNGEELTQDVVVTISSSDGNGTSYTIPASRFNDDTNSVHVCDIIMQTNEITEVMKDLNNNLSQH